MSRTQTSEEQSSETSPLLLNQDVIRTAELGNGIAPSGPIVITNEEEAKASANNGKSVRAEERDIEEQQNPTVESHIDEGLPDVQRKLYTIFAALTVGVFLGAVDQTVIVSSYVKIGSELHALSMTSWIATAYFMTTTSFQPLYGKLSDIFGRKSCLLFCYSVFGLGCLGCGLAQNMTQLIAARAIAGVGGGGMNVVGVVLISDIVPLRERGKWQGFFNVIFAAGSSAGGPLGGLFADSIGWRWIFIIQAPMCLVAIVAVSLALKMPKKHIEEVQWMEKLRRIDFPGALALIGTVFTLLVGLDRGSNVSWKSPICYGPLTASAVLFISFILIETKVAKEPFAPGHIIFNRSMIACYLCNFFSMAAAVSSFFYIPLYFQTVEDLSPIGVGIRIIPSTITGVSGSLSMGFYMQKTGKYYWATVCDYLILTTGLMLILLCSGPVISSIPLVVVGMCMLAFGNGAGLTTTLIGLLANAEHEDQAVAIACSYLFRSAGSAIGLALSSMVANQVLKDGLASRLPPLGLSEGQASEIAERVRESLAYLLELKPALREVVSDCYARGTTAAFGLELGFALAAFISAWFISEKALSRRV